MKSSIDRLKKKTSKKKTVSGLIRFGKITGPGRACEPGPCFSSRFKGRRFSFSEQGRSEAEDVGVWQEEAVEVRRSGGWESPVEQLLPAR